MALSNAEKQQRWRERHISRRRTVQHLASLLLRRAWSEEHIDELGQLLRSLIPSWYIADLRRALKTPTDKEMQARSEADEAATVEAWCCPQEQVVPSMLFSTGRTERAFRRRLKCLGTRTRFGQKRKTACS